VCVWACQLCVVATHSLRPHREVGELDLRRRHEVVESGRQANRSTSAAQTDVVVVGRVRFSTGLGVLVFLLLDDRVRAALGVLDERNRHEQQAEQNLHTRAHQHIDHHQRSSADQKMINGVIRRTHRN
jgi:hypothetical protein